MIRVLFALFILLAALFCGACFAATAPNILLITADDLGCQLSCYGEQRFRTPNLDSLADDGVRFEHFYVAQSSCSPSRSALLTGLWPHQNGQVGLAHMGFRMHSGQQTLPALLKAQGYHTGIIGKLHVEPKTAFPWDWMPQKEKMASAPTRNVRWVAKQSREFFTAVKKSGKPFFYYVNFFDPHGPYTPDLNQVSGVPENPLRVEDIKDPYSLGGPSDVEKARLTAVIANTILRVDAGMGLLLDELKAAGFADNTLVMFIGDNGLPLVRGKTSSYELGLRVPLLVRWPGVANAGLVRKELVSAIDLMPTILTAAGTSVPAKLTGLPVQPLLQGDPAKWREYLFTEMNFHSPRLCPVQRTVRDNRYKLLLNLAPKSNQARVELFDLQSDPGELKNLANSPDFCEVRLRLEAALMDWREKTADPLLDNGRVQRWKEAAERWSKLPSVKADAGPHIPEGELSLLK